jgi:hypothetical protein
VFDAIAALAMTRPPDWRAIAMLLKGLGWELERRGWLPDVIAHKEFKPGPEVAAYVR